jgi:hypothetical protein
MSEIQSIHKVLSTHRFPVHNEKQLQTDIAFIFERSGISYIREHILDNNNIIDFMSGDIGVEVKIKGNKKAIYLQCERYCDFPGIKSLLLITNRSMGFPKQINGKDCYVLNLGKAWL